MNIDEILKVLPQRYPFLMVDRVSTIDENGIVAYKNVTINEPFFQGHFPDYPLVPAVLQLEGLAQTTALLLHKEFAGKKGIPLFLGVDSARFLKEIRPGDRMEYYVQIKQKLGDFFRVNGQIKVNGNVAVKCMLFVGVKYFETSEDHV
jgi:3-hydroxyacyl-[acyl-carrier-protein] dehydratase